MCRILLTCIAALIILGSVAYGNADMYRMVIDSSDADQPGEGIVKEGIVGCVTTLDKYPVIGAFVQAGSLGGSSGPIPDMAILSDSAGCYQWPLLPGSYHLLVNAEGYKPATGRVTVSAGKVARLDFMLERAAGRD